MSMTDRDVLEQFRSIVYCGTVARVTKRGPPHHKAAWQWWANGDDFVHVFHLLAPWLCARRKEKGLGILKLRNERHANFSRERRCERCATLFMPSPRGTSTKSKMAGSVKTRFCSKECRMLAKNERRRAVNRAVFKPQRAKLNEEK